MNAMTNANKDIEILENRMKFLLEFYVLLLTGKILGGKKRQPSGLSA
jgi:hypothetical protein